MRKRKIVDLSKAIRENKRDPWFMRVKIKHKPHRRARWLIRLLGLPFRLFPKNFEGWADDYISMGVHAVTHIDAPWHYSPTTGGQRAKTIDEIDLEDCMGPGLLIDMSHKADFDPITEEDITAFLERENLVVEAGMIVLIRTGADRYNGQPDFHKRGTGMSAKATAYLIDRGVKVMGIDAWGWDTPLHEQIRQAKAANDATVFWEAHLVGQEKEYCHMEQLVNLGALPYSGFEVAVFPLKIVGASAAPARVLAFLEE